MKKFNLGDKVMINNPYLCEYGNAGEIVAIDRGPIATGGLVRYEVLLAGSNGRYTAPFTTIDLKLVTPEKCEFIDPIKNISNSTLGIGGPYR